MFKINNQNLFDTLFIVLSFEIDPFVFPFKNID